MEFFRNQEGQGLTEYITIVVLVSLAAVAAAASLGKSVKGKIRDAQKHIETQILIGEKKKRGPI